MHTVVHLYGGLSSLCYDWRDLRKDPDASRPKKNRRYDDIDQSRYDLDFGRHNPDGSSEDPRAYVLRRLANLAVHYTRLSTDLSRRRSGTVELALRMPEQLVLPPEASAELAVSCARVDSQHNNLSSFLHDSNDVGRGHIVRQVTGSIRHMIADQVSLSEKNNVTVHSGVLFEPVNFAYAKYCSRSERFKPFVTRRLDT